MKTVNVVIKSGHGVASGRSSTDKRFPDGTIRMQEPFFKEQGLDFSVFFDGDFIYGTLNLSLSPLGYSIAKPEHFFENIKWTDLQPAENFYLSAAEIHKDNKVYKALLYIPDPSTKPDHFQAPDVIEVIAQKIPDLNYGDKVTLAYNPEAIKIA